MTPESRVVAAFETARAERGISVAELARRIWYVLNGQREMRVDEFIRLCVFFDLGLGCFIDRATVEDLRSPHPRREM